MPGVFEKLGVRFQYPDNWTLDESEAQEQRNAVSVHSPDGGAFWSLMICDPGEDPAELARQVVSAMKAEYEDFEFAPLEETIAGRPSVGFEMNFYCLDLTSTAQVRGVSTPTGTLIIHCQAEDQEFEEFGRVFQAMTLSLLMELEAAE